MDFAGAGFCSSAAVIRLSGLPIVPELADPSLGRSDPCRTDYEGCQFDRWNQDVAVIGRPSYRGFMEMGTNHVDVGARKAKIGRIVFRLLSVFLKRFVNSGTIWLVFCLRI